eukprot:g4319.t1
MPESGLQTPHTEIPLRRSRTKPVSCGRARKAVKVIQTTWKINEKLRQMVKRRRLVQQRVRELSLYAVFLIVYTASTLIPLSSPDLFFFQEDLKGQFTGVEFLPEHSPTFGKTFMDVATVAEFHHWMLGPFLATAYSTGTFDGDPNPNAFNLSRYILGYGRKLG